jgi:TPR repeat protein
MGYAPAELQAGVWYRDGKIVSRDRSRAYFWLDKAASQGRTRASEYRDALARRMTSNELAEAKQFLGTAEGI